MIGEIMEYSLSPDINHNTSLDQLMKDTPDNNTNDTIQTSSFPWADYAFNTLLIIIDNLKHKNLQYHPFDNK